MGLTLVIPLSASAMMLVLAGHAGASRLDPVTRRQMAVSAAAADARMPSVKQVERLEARLARTGCVGRLAGWSRRYAFGLNDGVGLTTDKIVFVFRRASDGARPERKILPYRLFPDLDHDDGERVDGYQIASSGAVKITYCGPNRSSR